MFTSDLSEVEWWLNNKNNVSDWYCYDNLLFIVIYINPSLFASLVFVTFFLVVLNLKF